MLEKIRIPASDEALSQLSAADMPECQAYEATSETTEAATTNPTELSSVELELQDYEANPNTMGDAELCAVVQRVGHKYRHFNQKFLAIAPHIRALHKRFAKKGKRLPIDGNPTWAEFVTKTFGITDRYLRMLIFPAKKGTKKLREPLELGDVETLFSRMKRKPFVEAMDQAFKELELEDFASALEDLAQLIAHHYAPQGVIQIDIVATDEDDDPPELDGESAGPDNDARNWAGSGQEAQAS